MTSPRFVPRTYCRPTEQFGKSRTLQWKKPDSLTESELDQLGAAQLQHEYAYRIREALLSAGQTAKDFTETHGLDNTRFGRVLRGDVLMRFEDLANAERNLGLRLRPERALASMPTESLNN